MPKFVPRQRKRRVLERQRDQRRRPAVEDNDDANATEILPAVEVERQRKKNELKDAIRAEQPRMPSKKRKRLDKYIDKKLRKEENLHLIKKLASTKVDTGLLRSSRDLGVTKLSKREVLARALDEERAGVDVEKNQGILYRRQDDAVDVGSDPDSADAESDSESAKVARHAAAVVGSGLKRPLESGPDGNPIIKKRKRPKRTPVVPPTQIEDDGLSWDGLSDNDSLASGVSLGSSASTHTESDSGSASEETDVSLADSADESEYDDRKTRFSAFKAWATSQINEAVGFTPTSEQAYTPAINHNGADADSMHYEPKPLEIDPMPPELSVQSTMMDRKAHSVIVGRPDDIQSRRMELPIAGEEQRIMEAIHNSPTVIICGETGSGKTTQVPQFLYEAGYGSKDGSSPGMIGITQPRRVAAVSMASRVSYELGTEHFSKIAHQVRFDSSVSRDTAIKFMTDGILLREIAKDFALPRYSAIIVDEAHERSANTDILIGLLSRIVDLRETMSKEDSSVKPLRLIIMSATLRVQDFLDNKLLFRDNAPPLVQVEGRHHPVTSHFARRTHSDYIEQTFQKVCRGHRLLPPGGMLVFLTAQDEIHTMIQRLKEALDEPDNGDIAIDGNNEAFSDDEEAKEFHIDEVAPDDRTSKVHLLPLYSQLQTKDQLCVFEPPPGSSRLIVVATNVAETSLTIPGIRYVFDCGRSKEKKYDDVSGVQSFEVGWISKASASQREGRAGRIGPGHCYKLYSSAVFERDFEEHSLPEILRMPVEGVVLQLKSMEIHNVVNFPFPSPPDRQGLAKAEKLLMYLGALSVEGRITDSGREFTMYPTSPRYAKMLAVGHQFNCMAFAIVLVAALATPNIFISENYTNRTLNGQSESYTAEEQYEEEARLKRKSDYNHAHHLNSKLSRTSDALKAFTALQGYMKGEESTEYCRSMFLSPKPMQEASSLVEQLTSIIRNNAPLKFSSSSSKLSSPSKDQIAALQQFAGAGFLDQIAILASEAPSPPYIGRSPKRAIDVPYLPLFPISKGRHAADTGIRDIAVYVHPSSVLAHVAVKDMPKYLIYSHLQRSQPSTIEGSKRPRTRMHALTTITERTILALARGTPLLEYGKPLSILDEKVGERGKTRTCIVQPSLVGVKGMMGWPLPAQRVVQTRNTKGEWVVE